MAGNCLGSTSRLLQAGGANTSQSLQFLGRGETHSCSCATSPAAGLRHHRLPALLPLQDAQASSWSFWQSTKFIGTTYWWLGTWNCRHCACSWKGSTIAVETTIPSGNGHFRPSRTIAAWSKSMASWLQFYLRVIAFLAFHGSGLKRLSQTFESLLWSALGNVSQKV